MATILIGVTAFGIWVMNGPHTLNHLNDHIASAILPEESVYDLTIGSSQLQWDDWAKPFSLQLKNTRLLSGEQVVMVWPEVQVSVDFWELLSGRFKSRQLTVINPRFHIKRNADGRWVLLGGDSGFVDVQTLLGTRATDDSESAESFPIENMVVQNAEVRFEDEIVGIDIQSKQSNIEWQSASDLQSFKAFFTFDANGSPVGVEVDSERKSETNEMVLRIGLQQFNPKHVCQLITVCEGLPRVDIPLQGHLELIGDASMQFKTLHVDVQGVDGSFEYKPNFVEPITIDKALLVANYEFASKQLTVESGRVESGQMILHASAEYQQTEEGPFVSLTGKGSNIAIDDLYKYWPQHLAPESREWVINSINGGYSPESAISMTLKPEDLQSEFLPDDFLHAKVKLIGATVDYLDRFPPVKQVDGEVLFTGTTITANAEKGVALSGTKVSDATFFFSDLNHPKVPLDIKFSVEAPAVDVNKLLQPPRFNVLGRSGVSLSQAKGQLKGDLELSFDAFSGASDSSTVNWNNVTYKINSDIEGVSGIELRDEMRLDNSKGSLRFANNHIAIDLKALLNQAPVNLSYTDSKGKAVRYGIAGTLSAKQLAKLGLDITEHASGPIKSDISVVESTPEKLTATLDLENAIVSVGDLSYDKPAGIPASFKLSTTGHDGKELSDGRIGVAYKSTGLSLYGDVLIHPQTQQVERANIDSFKYLQSDLSIQYQKLPHTETYKLTGNRLNLEPFMDDSEDGLRLSEIDDIQLNMDLAHVRLAPGRELNEVKGHLHCKGICQSASLAAGLVGGGSLQMNIFNEGGTRQFKLQSNNAGNLFRVLDVTDRLNEGGLTISGKYNDSVAAHPLDGRFLLKSFTLKDAPILGRILNMSSLTGLVESLSSKGISFDKLGSDFVYANDAVTVKNAKATGPSLGILSEGKINFATNILDLKGSLAPAYTINSVVSKIPLIGEMLVGGEGEGVFAFSYSVKGHADKPDVSVNPLSVLTPGFTRKFFDIFDGPPPEGLNEEKPKEEVKPKKPLVKKKVEAEALPDSLPETKPVAAPASPTTPVAAPDSSNQPKKLIIEQPMLDQKN
ncbi:MAG: AsmA-like C-terminal domain-containing protein [Rickettsiales bacterium]|nr:AsmA-like C-terminal domain-containing protein [Rickettsiales bacterium]